MSTPESIRALRKANPRNDVGFAESVEVAALRVRTELAGVTSAGARARQSRRITRESGFKEGHTIRVLPFGFVAHDEAANPAAPLETTVTVGSDGIVREVRVEWGAWVFDVNYRDLGNTAAPKAPANAVPLRELRDLRK
jgi:hypothetical protein